jgi:hypothetical protein
MSDLAHEIEEAIRELAAQPAPPPIERQNAQYPWSPPAIETQPTRIVRPPPLSPDVIAERLPTVVVASSEHDVAMAIEGGIAAVQQVADMRRRLAELESTLKRMIRDVRALKFNFVQLEPHAARAPRLKALITTSLRTCDLALAAVGER